MTQAKMYMNKLILVLLCIGLFNACQPPVVFGEPQPAGVEALSTIPESYKGIYWCKVDSASLFVDDKAFIKRKEYFVKLTKNEIEEDIDLELRNGKLHVSSWGLGFPTEENGDTIISSVILRDTLFAIGPERLAKPFKGHLILNTKVGGETWDVLVASRKGKGILSLARADLPEDLARLDSVTPLLTIGKTDTTATQILITPTKEEFEQILEKRLLFDASCTEFERILPLNIDSN